MRLQTIINFIFILIVSLGIITFLFWRLGIFKKEVEMSKEFIEIKEKVEIINSYPYQDLGRYFQNLPATKMEIPALTPEEIGRQSLF